ncbi:hypothetical protein C8046_07950 [Serinibacter arcticus]|uniref:Lipoprotein n=1 Tax=Serinibacter arcticus TaxID=1655435 RepID=A0A2U1ZUG2_9MICO|nr:hypothetical protein [Serinibacter arcticus]PWD50593.1 hypothetical protein C8046_07950 [Serinibacter arcticus]
MSRTVTRLATGVVAGGLALVLSACSPVLTTKPYASSDGARVTWEGSNSVKGENVLVLAAAEGGPARIVGGLTNMTSESVELTFGFVDGESETLTINPRSTVLLNGTGENDVVLQDVPVGPGAIVQMSFSTRTLGEVVLPIPVLDGTLEAYADLVPEPYEVQPAGAGG